MDTKLQFFLFVFFVAAFLIGLLWSLRTEHRLRKFFAGKKAKDLEEKILLLEKNIENLESAKKETAAQLAGINQKLKKSVRSLEVLRFNPFPDQGGNQSFAVGMLDEEGNGLVLSSLYARDRMSVFCKPVKSGKSEYELTAEEREVLSKAKI